VTATSLLKRLFVKKQNLLILVLQVASVPDPYPDPDPPRSVIIWSQGSDPKLLIRILPFFTQNMEIPCENE
jgi:hypothetical protein